MIEGFGIPYGGTAAPTLILVLAAMFVGVWRRWVSLWAFEVILMVVLVAAQYGFLVTWRLAPAYVAAEPTSTS